MTSYIYNMVDTWNDGATTFTAVKMNVTDTASNAASLLMDLQIGGSSRFQVAKDGAIGIPVAKSLYQIGNTGFNITFSGSGAIALNSAGGGITVNGPVTVGATDLILSRRAAANLRLGAVDAAAPVAQTLSVQSVVAGTSNTAGTNLTITGSQGTGTGAGGSIIFQVAPAGSTGTAQNALSTALTINSDRSITLGQSSPIIIASDTLRFDVAGVTAFAVVNTAAGLRSAQVRSDGQFAFTSSSPTSAADTILARDAANTLALRNGTAAQAFNLYGTYTDASNYRRAALAMTTAGVATLKPEGAGTGVSGNVLHISGLPTSNPGPGILWNNAGTPAIGT